MNVNNELYQRIEDQKLWDKTLRLKKDGYLKLAGTVDTNLYFILAGSVKVFILNDGEEHIIRLGYQHNFISALDSFITERPSEFYIQAIKAIEIRMISKIRLLEFFRSSPENRSLWDRVLEQLILQHMEREKDILISSPRERYERVLARSPQLFQEIPNKYIASYLRMSPETLSRLKKS